MLNSTPWFLGQYSNTYSELNNPRKLEKYSMVVLEHLQVFTAQVNGCGSLLAVESI